MAGKNREGRKRNENAENETRMFKTRRGCLERNGKLMTVKRAVQETVLYYAPEKRPYTAKLKGVLVRMGIRIRDVSADQVLEQVGALAGIREFQSKEFASEELRTKESEYTEGLPVIPEEMLVMHRFSSQRIDELLANLRKAGVPKIQLKAVVTETNCQWTFYHLYEEISAEHAKMQKNSLT